MMSSFATALGLIVRYPVIAVTEMLRRARTAGLVKRRWTDLDQWIADRTVSNTSQHI
jgi:hypothetical protein